MSDMQTRMRAIIKDTSEAVFETAGGFEFTDELAVNLDTKWRKQEHGPVVVSAVDLAWLIDGYARARLASTKEG